MQLSTSYGFVTFMFILYCLVRLERCFITFCFDTSGYRIRLDLTSIFAYDFDPELGRFCVCDPVFQSAWSKLLIADVFTALHPC